MIISHRKKFIFIHIPKNAGTSISDALSPYDYTYEKAGRWFNRLGEKLNLIPANSFSDGFPHQRHWTALEVKNNIPAAIFRSYHKFAVVRNPWEREVSLYEYIKRHERHPLHHRVATMSFEQYIDFKAEGPNSKHPKFTYRQLDYITDREGELLIDHYLRHEHLEEDFQKLCKHLGLKSLSLGKLNRSEQKDYKSYYSARTVKAVADFFKRDIEAFNYSYEWATPPVDGT